ncbi:MAG TPA: ABC transporter permease [Sphingomicrobium sp.]|nr:ABC transporter permease [Sphingomicrobium sp.]
MSWLQAILRLIPVYGLPLLAIVLIILFSVLLPTTFPTLFNVRSILSDKSIVALLALSALLPMIAGRIDLTIGYGIVLWHILAISLQTVAGFPWELAVLVVLACGALAGLVNGILVEVAQIDSFIATLGTGTVLYAIALWHTGGKQMIGALPQGFLSINARFVLGMPITALYVLVLAIVLWLVTERMPIGRQLYAIGASPKAAALNGIPVRRYVMITFVISGLLTACTGVILASKLRIGQAGVGLEYLLPALVGVFLGSTTIKPGRVNVWGTVVAVLVLAIGISGIQQFGGEFYVEPLFNGGTLIAAIALAGYSQRHRRSAQ